MINLDSVWAITLPTKICTVKAMVSSSDVWMWELDHKESWALKNWSFRTVVLENTLESPLDFKEITAVNSEGSQPYEYSFEVLTIKLKLQYFGHLMWRADSLKKTDGYKRRRVWQRMRGLDNITDSMDTCVWATPGDSGGQRSLVCCTRRGCKQLDTT